jgi:hypothetical protein
VLPRGVPGPKGDAGDNIIQRGFKITEVVVGESAEDTGVVYLSTTTDSAGTQWDNYRLKLPLGPQGEQGEQGEPGPQGADGFVWARHGRALLARIYPVGAIHISLEKQNPRIRFGAGLNAGTASGETAGTFGTWELLGGATSGPSSTYYLCAHTADDTGPQGGHGAVWQHQSVGTNAITITAANVPPHVHPVSAQTVDTTAAGAHTHTFRNAGGGETSQTWALGYPRGGGWDFSEGSFTANSSGGQKGYVTNIQDAPAHTHSISVPAHTTGTQQAATAPLNIQPQALRVYLWVRTS